MKMKITHLFMLLFLLSSCTKNVNKEAGQPIEGLQTLPEVKKNLMEQIIKIARVSPQFKKTVEQECLKQVRGDYNVALDRLIEIDNQNSIIPLDQKQIFVSLTKQMKMFNPGGMPIIFVPVMESRDPSLINPTMKLGTSGETNVKGHTVSLLSEKSLANSNIVMVDRENQVFLNNNGTLINKSQKDKNITVGPVVRASNMILPPDDGSGGGSSCNAPYGYPGYVVDNYGNLTYFTCITEDLAWTNDVWVLGYEEGELSPDNRVASPNDVEAWTTTTESRYEGINEYGGQIQVLDLGQIESWVNGKPEFKYFVYNSTGTLIKEHAFGKWRRSHFRNQQWFYMRDFIGNWNTSNWGTTTYERWIEEDGGNSVALNYTISYNINGVTYTTTISSPARSRDEDLGLANVQFTDASMFIPLTDTPDHRTIYTLNYMNMQREHY